ncbi:hypothetical protein [Lacrimispora indolis]|uniref:hypothetical protein n=1 Tax=Lacrimispora indolis TaxID=69825 RepID=UPI00045EB7B8|nr:hypothetical protein [Lacrimispora indolis]
MYIVFPTLFHVRYPKKNKLYYNSNNIGEIKKILWISSKGFCMYCGRKIDIDNQIYSDIEHSVEKKGQYEQNGKESILTHCKFNMSLSCSKCNQKYKTRMLESIELDEKDYDIKTCLSKQCSRPCKKYIRLKTMHCHYNNIILQPGGVKYENIQCQIVYNLVKHTYEPMYWGKNKQCDDYIWNHISRFHLNREMKSESIIKVCEFIINLYENFNQEFSINQFKVIMDEYIYENYLAILFVDYIVRNFRHALQIYEFCKFIIILSFL